jgi:hypothetical protein
VEQPHIATIIGINELSRPLMLSRSSSYFPPVPISLSVAGLFCDRLCKISSILTARFVIIFVPSGIALQNEPLLYAVTLITDTRRVL